MAWLLVAGLLMVLCAGGSVVVTIFMAIAVPNFVRGMNSAKRAEAPAQVEGIREAELAYAAAFGRFLPCGTRGAAGRALTVETHPWEEDPSAACFGTLGWSPDHPPRGGYWVTVDAEAGDFTVYGMVDVDGDGHPAEYRASRDQVAASVTPDNVY